MTSNISQEESPTSNLFDQQKKAQDRFDPGLFFVDQIFHRDLNMLTPKISATTKKTTKTKKIIFAMDAAPAAISVNPKIEAISAMTKKISDHLSIIR